MCNWVYTLLYWIMCNVIERNWKDQNGWGGPLFSRTKKKIHKIFLLEIYCNLYFLFISSGMAALAVPGDSGIELRCNGRIGFSFLFAKRLSKDQRGRFTGEIEWARCRAIRSGRPRHWSWRHTGTQRKWEDEKNVVHHWKVCVVYGDIYWLYINSSCWR